MNLPTNASSLLRIPFSISEDQKIHHTRMLNKDGEWDGNFLGPYQDQLGPSIGVRLSANKLNLIRGEQTTLTATLSGLNGWQGLTGPVSMQLTNATPWTVRMEGGESQVTTASPEYFKRGVFIHSHRLLWVDECRGRLRARFFGVIG